METFLVSTKVPESWAVMAEENMKAWAKHWPCLMDEPLLTKCKQMVNLNESEIHSGHRTKNTLISEKFYKLMDSANVNNEAMFFAFLEKKYEVLKPFVSEFLGVAVKNEKGTINSQASSLLTLLGRTRSSSFRLANPFGSLWTRTPSIWFRL